VLRARGYSTGYKLYSSFLGSYFSIDPIRQYALQSYTVTRTKDYGEALSLCDKVLPRRIDSAVQRGGGHILLEEGQLHCMQREHELYS